MILTQNFRGPICKEIRIHVYLAESSDVEVAEIERRSTVSDPLGDGSAHSATTHHADRTHTTRQEVVVYLQTQQTSEI